MSIIEQKYTDISASLKILQRKKLDCGLNVPKFFDLEWIKSMKDTVKLRPDDIIMDSHLPEIWHHLDPADSSTHHQPGKGGRETAY